MREWIGEAHRELRREEKKEKEKREGEEDAKGRKGRKREESLRDKKIYVEKNLCIAREEVEEGKKNLNNGNYSPSCELKRENRIGSLPPSYVHMPTREER